MSEDTIVVDKNEQKTIPIDSKVFNMYECPYPNKDAELKNIFQKIPIYRKTIRTICRHAREQKSAGTMYYCKLVDKKQLYGAGLDKGKIKIAVHPVLSLPNENMYIDEKVHWVISVPHSVWTKLTMNPDMIIQINIQKKDVVVFCIGHKNPDTNSDDPPKILFVCSFTREVLFGKNV